MRAPEGIGVKLYMFKAKYLKQLILYRPKNSREAEIRDILISKLENLRSMTMPYFLRTLHEIVAHEKSVSDELKKIVMDMIREAPVEGEEE